MKNTKKLYRKDGQPISVGWKVIHTGHGGTERAYEKRPPTGERERKKQKRGDGPSTLNYTTQETNVPELPPGQYSAEEMAAVDALNETVKDPGDRTSVRINLLSVRQQNKLLLDSK
jgi:hypothetical protein